MGDALDDVVDALGSRTDVRVAGNDARTVGGVKWAELTKRNSDLLG